MKPRPKPRPRPNAPAPPKPPKRAASLIWKLNGRLFLRRLSVFLVMDLLLLALGVAGLSFYAETQAAAYARLIDREGRPGDAAAQWIEASGVTVTAGRPVNGHALPALPPSFLPAATAEGERYLQWGEEGEDLYPPRWEANLPSLVYSVNLPAAACTVNLELRTALRAMIAALLLLLLGQTLSLLGGLVSGARLARRTLRPIEQLAAAAHSLNASIAASPEELMRLAASLDQINATHLDARIKPDEIQDELKSVAHAINGMLDRLEQSYRLQTRFVSDASHELRTPIAVIQGYANLLDRWGKNDPQAMQESIDAIRSEAASMKDLVEQLLFLARGDSDNILLKKTVLDLTALAAKVVDDAAMLESDRRFVTRLDQPVYISADDGLMKQLLRILVDNSIKYSPAGGTITVSAVTRGAQALLTVQDEGIGIKPEALPSIFDRFFRAEDSRARATGGAGLGLAIAMWIVQRHGGHFEILSREGLGTRITAALPAAPPPSTEENALP